MCVCAVHVWRNLTPQGHEDREEDGGWVVKQVAGSRRAAGYAQVPVAADPITHRAHDDTLPVVTDLHAAEAQTHTVSDAPGCWRSIHLNLFQSVWSNHIRHGSTWLNMN